MFLTEINIARHVPVFIGHDALWMAISYWASRVSRTYLLGVVRERPLPQAFKDRFGSGHAGQRLIRNVG
jgi:hypothetical protein